MKSRWVQRPKSSARPVAPTAIGTFDDVANSMAIQSDGKLVAAGYSNNGTQNVFALVRYLP